MNARAKTFGSPEEEPSTTTRLMPQQMCEKLWTLPKRGAVDGELCFESWGPSSSRRPVDMPLL